MELQQTFVHRPKFLDIQSCIVHPARYTLVSMKDRKLTDCPKQFIVCTGGTFQVDASPLPEQLSVESRQAKTCCYVIGPKQPEGLVQSCVVPDSCPHMC